MWRAIFFAISSGSPCTASSTGRSLATSRSISRTWMKQSPSTRGICWLTSAITTRADSAADLTMSVDTP